MVLSYRRRNVPTMTDARREEARRLRVDPGLSLSELMKHFGVGAATLTDWLRGIEPPVWTRRPNAKDELRAQALQLREQGWSVNDLAVRLGVAKSTAYAWVKHIALDPSAERARQKQEHAALMTAARWDDHRRRRDSDQAAFHAEAARQVGDLSERDLLIVGAAIYWCEGAKSKPWRRVDRLTFINSDPGLLNLFLRFLNSCGRPAESLRYRVHIHETADAEAAADWWAAELGLPRGLFQRATIKRHAPATRRQNTGDGYHGCLAVSVPQSRELYWRVEGVMAALTRLR
jgi:transposase-like protein